MHLAPPTMSDSNIFPLKTIKTNIAKPWRALISLKFFVKKFCIQKGKIDF